MPSGIESLDGNRFILRYEHPWGGIASNAAPEDIAPNQLQSSDGIFIRNGRLCSTNFYSFNPTYYRHSTTASLYWTGVTGIQAIYTVGTRIVAIDSTCRTYTYNLTDNFWVPDPFFLSTTNPPRYSCSIMIDKVIYIFDYDSATEYVFTPGVSIVQAKQMDPNTGPLQNFVGGLYCMTVDRYLITANFNMPSDLQKAKRTNGYAWSKPSAYTTFDPSLDLTRTEGWNYLAEVQQEITGCFAMGNVGYILHDQGITQLTPTGGASSGILPFDATLLWGGRDGNGCTYPDSLSVYGYIAIWGNNTDFYMFGAGSAPQSITGTARKAIYEDLNRFKYLDNKFLSVSGNLINAGVDDRTPELVYNLYIVYESPGNSVPINMIIWSFIFGTQTWTRTAVNATDMMRLISGNQSYSSPLGTTAPAAGVRVVVPSALKFPDLSGTSFTGSNIYIGGTYGGVILNTQGAIGDSFFMFQYINTDGLSTISDVPPITNLKFRAEEFQVYRQPTIRGVILRAGGQGTLNVSVGGQSFTPIVVNSMDVTAIYRSFGVHTGLDPSVNITSTDFNGFITKVHAFGTYAEGEPI